jgi:hypothetical protein
MKTLLKFKQIIVLVILVVFAVGACTKDFEELNTDPNNPTNVPAINIFSYVIEDAVDDWLGQGWVNHTYMANWSQQWCKVQYIDEDRYQVRPENRNGFFEDPYMTELMDLKVILEKTAPGGENENNPLYAAARIFRVWVFQQLTDLFGDIPYSQALQGDVAGSSVFPVYDSQQSIYEDMLDELEECNTILSSLTPPELNFGEGDLLYGGDSKAWQKFGNSLYLRLLNRCHAVYSGADAKIAEILNNPAQYPIMESNDDNCKLDYPGVLPYRNGTFETLYTRTDQAISQTMVNWLKVRNDPRLPIYAKPVAADTIIWTNVDPVFVQNPPAEWRIVDDPKTANVIDSVMEPAPSPSYFGQQNGAAAQPNLSFRSMLGTAIAYDPAAPLYLLTYDEVEFIKAEYYLRANNDAAAQTAYETGIDASMERWGADYDEATYLTDPLVAWNGSIAQKQKLICEQHWAAIFGEGVEAYAEVRRTGYPSRIFEYELEKTMYPGFGLPTRFCYPINEESYNPDNLKAAKQAQGVQEANEGMFGSRLWWQTQDYPIPTTTDVQGPGYW